LKKTMNPEWYEQPFVFPKWANYLLPAIVIGVVGGLFYVPTVVGLGGSPKTTAVGYSPVQPIPYSHALHAGKLGIDCRYCHNTVESTAFASIPPIETCMNCHTNIRNDAASLLPLREAWNPPYKPLQWIKVHDLPQYVYFNHSAHVNHGVGCIECHGRIDQMEQVYQAKPLSMGWCLDCHRDPGPHLRPKDQVTNMNWIPPEDPTQLARALLEGYRIHDTAYMTSCSTCHR
jgi:menaquinone reductase, multiheme cytochrome c subunit